LAGVAFAGVHAAELVELVAVGAVELVAEHDGAACRVAEGGQDAAEGIGHEEGGSRRAAAAQFADEMTSQRVVVGAALQVASAVVAVFFQAEGVDGYAGGAANGAALDAAVSIGVVGIPCLVRVRYLPLDHLIELVIGEGRCLAVVGALADVAPAIVLHGVTGCAGIGAGRGGGVALGPW